MDTNNINFNKLWGEYKSDQPTIKDLHFKLNSYKKQNIRRILISNVIFIITTASILFIWYYYKPQYITTKIGIVLSIVAMFIFIISLNRNIYHLKNIDESKSNQYFLQSLLSLKARQQYIHTTMLNLYFILFSTGLGLYMYEYTSRMDAIWAFFFYGMTSLWILFNWFYLRPKQIKKQNNRLNDIIIKFELINNQLND